MKKLNLKSTTLQARFTVLLIAIFGTLLLVSGCNNTPVTSSETGTVTGTGSDDNISLSMQSFDNMEDNAELQIREAKGLLTEIEVESDSAVKRIKAGPIAVNLDVEGLNKVMTSGILPAGTYKKIKFQLHKPEDNETIPDSEFREGSSGNQRYSFIIKGSYNGTGFVFKSRKSVNIVIDLSSPLNLAAKSNVTILFDKMKWFRNGSSIINPNGNDDERDMIDDNIKDSFRKAFRDDDKNGVPDGQ
jgi:hypothetical protein